MPFWVSAGERYTLNFSSALRCLPTKKRWQSFLSSQAHLALNRLVRSNLSRENIIIAVVVTILKRPHRCRGRRHAGCCDNYVIHKPPCPCDALCPTEALRGARWVWQGTEGSSWTPALKRAWVHTDIHLVLLCWQAAPEAEVFVVWLSHSRSACGERSALLWTEAAACRGHGGAGPWHPCSLAGFSSASWAPRAGSTERGSGPGLSEGVQLLQPNAFLCQASVAVLEIRLSWALKPAAVSEGCRDLAELISWRQYSFWRVPGNLYLPAKTGLLVVQMRLAWLHFGWWVFLPCCFCCHIEKFRMEFDPVHWNLKS